jgi:U3 small nucleolar RNA-associated protein 11
MLADQPMNKHTVFVDSEAALAAFEPADYFNTDSDLVGRAFNRPHRETLEAPAALAGASRDARSMRSVKRERDRSYAELDARIDRADKMARLEDTIDRDRELLKKGRRLKVAEAQGGQPATFKWKTQRKK